jgi:hypothetical protein
VVRRRRQIQAECLTTDAVSLLVDFGVGSRIGGSEQCGSFLKDFFF